MINDDSLERFTVVQMIFLKFLTYSVIFVFVYFQGQTSMILIHDIQCLVYSPPYILNPFPQPSRSVLAYSPFPAVLPACHQDTAACQQPGAANVRASRNPVQGLTSAALLSANCNGVLLSGDVQLNSSVDM